MVQHVRTSGEDCRQRVGIAFAVGDQKFDGRAGIHFPNRVDCRREHGGATVRKIVARDACDDGVREPENSDRFGNSAGLVGIDGERLACIDEAEAACARASIAEDHERRGPLRPAFVDVRTAGLFADRVQLRVAHQPLELEKLVVEASAYAHPVRSVRRKIGIGSDARFRETAEQLHWLAGDHLGRTPRHVLTIHDIVSERFRETQHGAVHNLAHVDMTAGTAEGKREALEAHGIRVGTTPTEAAQLAAEVASAVRA